MFFEFLYAERIGQEDTFKVFGFMIQKGVYNL